MAQTGYTPILTYASGTASNVPSASNLTSSASGAELALNYADGKLFYKDSSGVVQVLATKAGASGDVVGPSSATDNALARFDTTTGKLIQNSVGVLSDAGVLTGLTGLTSSGSITFGSLTATRVTYAGASGLLTDSANLTFNGTDLTVSGAVNAGTINATTLDLTNLEVTNIKAKDGTAGMQIADSTGVVSFTANPVLSGGTANGVTYLNGSKVLTSGSALTFDGTTFTASSGGSTPALRVFGAVTSQGQLSFNSTDSYKIQGGPDYLGINFFTNSVNRYSIDSTGVAVWSVAGSEQMRLTSTGLGIGTSSPGTKLDVAGTARVQSNFFVYGTGDRLNVFPQTAGSGVQLLVTNNANSAYAPLTLEGSAQIYNISGGEQMRLTSTGLGIGTSSPANKLDVQGASNPAARIWSTGGTIGNYAELKLNAYNNFSGQSQSYIRAISTASGNSGTALAFAVEDNGFGNPAEGMRLTSTGLGIGTSSPSASAILDAQSTTKGVRMPNMTTTQKNAIASPAAGLMVFDTTLSKLCVYSGAAWETITSI